MIDCREFDSMLEIFGKLDKSNTLLNFRCVIFRSAIFQNKISLMKPDTFDFNSLLAFQLQLYPYTILLFLLPCF